MYKQIHLVLSLVKKLGLVLIGLFTFFFFIEMVRAYQTLNQIHHLVGKSFILAIITGGIFIISQIMKTLRKIPKRIKPPPVNSSNKQVFNYFVQISNRLLSNRYLGERKSAINQIQNAILKESSKVDEEGLSVYIDRLKVEVIGNCLNQLDQKSDVVIRDTVRDTMIAVTLSPYRSIDGLMVIYRNLSMYNQLVRLYNQRPTISEFFGYLFDVAKLVAGVNILGYTEKLTERLLSNVPLLDRASDDIIQGIGSGILTTSVGRATIQRCRSFGDWDLEIEKENYRETVKSFYGYVKDILSADVMPTMKRPFSKGWDTMKSKLFKKEEKNI